MIDADRQTSGQAAQPIEPLALFEILVRENADSLTAFLRASLRRQQAVDDLFQDTMLIAWRKIGEYDRARPFGAWLRGIAKRLVLAHYRLAGREAALGNERVLDFLDQRMAQVDSQPGDTLSEKIAALGECIKRLAPPYREPIELHYRHQQPLEAIAERLAATRDAVQKRLQRARAQLSQCLENKGILKLVDEP